MPRTYKPVTSGDEMLAELIVLTAKAHKITGYEYDPQTGELTTPEGEKEIAAAKAAEKELKAAEAKVKKAEKAKHDAKKKAAEKAVKEAAEKAKKEAEPKDK